MKNYLIADRYARALSASIPELVDLEEAVAALNRLCALYQKDHHLHSVLANPSINVERRVKVLAEIMAAETMPSIITRLTETLLRRGRIVVLPDVAEVFAMHADERLNRVRALVTTASPLDTAQESTLAKTLEKVSGKTVRIQTAVDPEILGGVVSRVGSHLYDGSVRTRIAKLRMKLLTEEE